MKVTLRIHSRLKARIVGAVHDATTATLVRAAPFVVAELARIADAKLHETASDYKSGLLDAVQLVNGGLRVELTGITKDLEVGYPARDMKTELLASSSAKQGKSGKYVDIPFKHALKPDASTLQGMPAEVRSKVQASARAERIAARSGGRPERNPLRVTGSMKGGTHTQQRIAQLVDRRKNVIGRGINAVEVTHKTSVHSNMIRTKFGKSSSYNTIRRISANSDPQSWWHPGFRGIRALHQLTPALKAMLKLVYKQELSRKGLKAR